MEIAARKFKQATDLTDLNPQIRGLLHLHVKQLNTVHAAPVDSPPFQTPALQREGWIRPLLNGSIVAREQDKSWSKPKNRTLERWEQGRGKVNSQAAVLLLLVRHYPDTLERAPQNRKSG
jgi:hypothetical protein